MSATQRLQVEGIYTDIEPEPPVNAYEVKMSPPALTQVHADADSLLKALNQRHMLNCETIDIDVLRSLSKMIRSWKWQFQASVRQNEVISIGPWPTRQLGLAIDLGTTKIAGYLVDLSSGATLVSKGTMNPQISYGEDVISRINIAMRSSSKRAQLMKLTITALNRLAAELCADINAKTEQIVEAVVVGNTAMHHLLLGLPVRQLALSPFVPAISNSMNVKARDMGLHISPGAYVHFLPNIAGFVGGDHVAMLLATDIMCAKGIILALDIGTNTEISLIAEGHITTVSCASGPAFEGYHIKHGMRASSGAIERVRIDAKKFMYQTIDGKPPIGICGSGILDAVAQLRSAGVLDRSGRMHDSQPGVVRRGRHLEFVLVDEQATDGNQPIVITQKDIRELQLAKAAIGTGIQVLLETRDYTEDDVDGIVIAGAFGSYIDVSSAIAIGMLPSISLENFRQVGNAAGMGAKMALVSLSRRQQTASLASQVQYVELASTPNFTNIFVQANYLGK
jgi:uncharacterized 2Fe-2S/4Fe-4S cluster protein (DUF4445 family)